MHFPKAKSGLYTFISLMLLLSPKHASLFGHSKNLVDTGLILENLFFGVMLKPPKQLNGVVETH